MTIGERYAFLQWSDSTSTSISTAPVTITYVTTALTDPAVRVSNVGTATVWIGFGARSTSSAAITTKGLMIPPAPTSTNAAPVFYFFRTGGGALAACCVGATQTTTILVTGGEGGR